jgi:hypothetical protein
MRVNDSFHRADKEKVISSAKYGRDSTISTTIMPSENKKCLFQKKGLDK